MVVASRTTWAPPCVKPSTIITTVIEPLAVLAADAVAKGLHSNILTEK